MALAEAGSKVYCLDLQPIPGSDFEQTKEYVSKLADEVGSLNYVNMDMTKKTEIWKTVEDIGPKEGRLNVAIAGVGIFHSADCLEYKDVEFQRVMDMNTNGVLYTAQAACRQTRTG